MERRWRSPGEVERRGSDLCEALDVVDGAPSRFLEHRSDPGADSDLGLVPLIQPVHQTAVGSIQLHVDIGAGYLDGLPRIGVDIGQLDHGESVDRTLGAEVHPIVHGLEAAPAYLSGRHIDPAAMRTFDAQDGLLVPESEKERAYVVATMPVVDMLGLAWVFS